MGGARWDTFILAAPRTVDRQPLFPRNRCRKGTHAVRAEIQRSNARQGCEPPRFSRRLQQLSRVEHQEQTDEQVFRRSPRTRFWHGDRQRRATCEPSAPRPAGYRAAIGVKPICKHLPIAPSTFYDHPPSVQTVTFCPIGQSETRRCGMRSSGSGNRTTRSTVFARSGIKGGAKAPKWPDARWPRSMKDIGIEGVIRGKKPKTTTPDESQPCPLENVNRQFTDPAPNVLWVSDFTYCLAEHAPHV